MGSKSSRQVPKHLPVATGPYTVGCVDIMADSTLQGRFMRLYYPTHKQDVMEQHERWPTWLANPQYLSGYLKFGGFHANIWAYFFSRFVDDACVPVLWKTPVLGTVAPYPVVVFSHGLGANRTCYSNICYEVASHGFVVASVEHRDKSASMTYYLDESVEGESGDQKSTDTTSDAAPGLEKNKLKVKWYNYEPLGTKDEFDFRHSQVKVRAEEVKKALDLLEELNLGANLTNALGSDWDLQQLKGAMDLSKAAVMGHSFGGATTLAALKLDPRFKVGIAFDAWMLPLEEEYHRDLDQPLLLINYETFHWRNNIKKMLPLQTKLVDRLLITIMGTCHQTITDFQFVVDNRTIAKSLRMRHVLDPYMAMEINAKATLGFLRKHLDVPGELHSAILNAEHEHVLGGTNIEFDIPHHLGTAAESSEEQDTPQV